MTEDLREETREALKQISTATLTTQLFKRGLRNQFLRGVRRANPNAPRLVGAAFTLRYIPAREDLDHVGVFQDPEHPQRKSIETVPPGEVLVMDCRGDASAASAGDILVTRLMVRGVAGIVSDGGLRDFEHIAAMEFPVFCAGPSAPLNLARHHAVDANRPIACGGVAVYPGDVMVGDGDGVVVVPRHLANEIAVDGLEQEQLEEFVIEEVRSGQPLRGTYPPNDDTMARYEVWRRKRGTTDGTA
ncbi:MAG: ribonuclease activity regulator RraA [Minwuiales bacterium]|nr:ribonuclease activity regulator RraA [Minwuiales bacterium]